MNESSLVMRHRMTVAEALAAIRTLKPESEEIHHLFVVDRHGRLSGEISFRQPGIIPAAKTRQGNEEEANGQQT